MSDLVIVHGGRYNAASWNAVAERLGAATSTPFDRILLLTIPGSGSKRARVLDGVPVDAIAQELNGEVESAGLDRPILVGHAIAGVLLPELARSFDYGALCFVTAAVPETGQAPADIFGDGVHGSDPRRVGYPVDPALVDQRELDRARFCLDMDAEWAEEWLDECHDDVIPPMVMHTPVRPLPDLPPTTYIVATRSPVFPVEWQYRFAARLGPDVRTATIATGHAPFLTHPDELAALLSELYG